MQEIEVKARVRDQAALLEELDVLGVVLGEPRTQSDEVYTPDGEIPAFQPGAQFLRVREEPDRVILTFKQTGRNPLDNTEREVVVSNAQEMRDIILKIGFKFALRIKKTRRTGQYKNISVCLDEVEKLGTFIELERLVEEGDAEEIQTELFNFLEELGISKEDRVTDRYDTLVKQLQSM